MMIRSEHSFTMSETPSKVSNWFLQYWYQLRSTFPMFSSIGYSVRPDDGPAYLFSTSFSAQLVMTDFMTRFALVPWMTYRKDFKSIEGYNSDCGWGCMLRSAQMMLAEALFRRECSHGSSVASLAIREKVIRLFADRSDCPYSIHEMSRHAARYGKRAGEWFEPTLTLLIVCDMLKDRIVHDHLSAVVARDGVLDASSIVRDSGVNADALREFDPLLNPRQQNPTSVLLLIPLRLGLRALNEDSYGDALLEALRFPQSIGMIGGKPAHSLYFCGSQGRRLVFLDPHTVQSADSCSDLSTYQCMDARAMGLSEVDPSLALGFLISSLDDFYDFKRRVEALPGPAMFSIITKPVELPLTMDVDDDFEEDEFEKVGTPYSPVVVEQTVEQQQQQEKEKDVGASFTAVNASEVKLTPKKKKEDFLFL
jgi:cysteine protease ATG4